MSNECKQARNIVGLAMIILMTLCMLLSMSSCSTSSCVSYGGWDSKGKLQLGRN